MREVLVARQGANILDHPTTAQSRVSSGPTIAAGNAVNVLLVKLEGCNICIMQEVA